MIERSRGAKLPAPRRLDFQSPAPVVHGDYGVAVDRRQGWPLVPTYSQVPELSLPPPSGAPPESNRKQAEPVMIRKCVVHSVLFCPSVSQELHKTFYAWLWPGQSARSTPLGGESTDTAHYLEGCRQAPWAKAANLRAICEKCGIEKGRLLTIEILERALLAFIGQTNLDARPKFAQLTQKKAASS